MGLAWLPFSVNTPENLPKNMQKFNLETLE
jgi:hypothetical protein